MPYWGRVAAGRYQGVACHCSLEAVVAQISEVSVDAGHVCTELFARLTVAWG